ncbi:MAG: hypothetical protein JKX84_02150 [Flavobacteriales bacterium]|nr:hypothetical protein [Flavobacteriales bacterium]
MKVTIKISRKPSSTNVISLRKLSIGCNGKMNLNAHSLNTNARHNSTSANILPDPILPISTKALDTPRYLSGYFHTFLTL